MTFKFKDYCKYIFKIKNKTLKIAFVVRMCVLFLRCVLPVFPKCLWYTNLLMFSIFTLSSKMKCWWRIILWNAILPSYVFLNFSLMESRLIWRYIYIANDGDLSVIHEVSELARDLYLACFHRYLYFSPTYYAFGWFTS